jgi:hypothetical protein
MKNSKKQNLLNISLSVVRLTFMLESSTMNVTLVSKVERICRGLLCGIR